MERWQEFEAWLKRRRHGSLATISWMQIKQGQSQSKMTRHSITRLHRTQAKTGDLRVYLRLYSRQTKPLEKRLSWDCMRDKGRQGWDPWDMFEMALRWKDSIHSWMHVSWEMRLCHAREQNWMLQTIELKYAHHSCLILQSKLVPSSLLSSIF